MRLINELLISFATTRRHIHLVRLLRPRPRPRPSLSSSFRLCKQLLQWSRSAPWQLQHNIIMRWCCHGKEVGGFFRLGAICCNPISSPNNVRVWVCVLVLYYFSSTCLHTHTPMNSSSLLLKFVEFLGCQNLKPEQWQGAPAPDMREPSFFYCPPEGGVA